MNPSEPRLLILGAHPDDAEYHSGGLATLYSRMGATVRIVSVTDGSAGHHQMQPADLALRRRLEAGAAGKLIGADYVTWDHPDGSLQPSLDLREDIIREMRSFQPDLLLTHRTCDYHPDHRAVGQAVQDACYMVTVPLILPDLPVMEYDPVVAYMPDPFTRPVPMRADIIIPIDDCLETIVKMLACHESQFFEFLPHNMHATTPVPEQDDGKRQWLTDWYCQMLQQRRERFDLQLVAHYGSQRAATIKYIEVYEVSEYGRSLDGTLQGQLFPFLSTPQESP